MRIDYDYKPRVLTELLVAFIVFMFMTALIIYKLLLAKGFTFF